MTIPLPKILYDYTNFTLERLERILPVAQTQRLGEMEFTMLAIECYTAGFVGTFLIEHDWRVPDPPPQNDPELPPGLRGLLFITDVVDDLGNHYIGHIGAGSGGGGGPDGHIRLHMVYCFAPALDPNARSLTLTLLQVERPQYDHGPPVWSDDQVVAGPWTVSIAVDSKPADRRASITVLPIAQQVTATDIRVTMTTLERHPHGFVVNCRVDCVSDAPFPRLAWHPVDDRGGTYGRGNCAGGGRPLDDNMNSWRMNCHFTPALAPDASELRLRLTSAGSQQPVRSAEHNGVDRWEVSRVAIDAGEITVVLRP